MSMFQNNHYRIPLYITVTVRYENTEVRDDESAGILTFALITSKPPDEPFTVQVFTMEISNVTGLINVNFDGFATG